MSVVRWRVTWDGRAIAGVDRLTTMSRTTEVVEHRDGGDPGPPRKVPGRTGYAPVLLEREITDDPDFAAWAEAVAQSDGSGARDFRKDVHLELLDEAGEIVLAYTLHRAWVSRYQPVAVSDAAPELVAKETITVDFESWQRHPPAL